MTVTIKDLELHVYRINDLLGTPKEPYGKGFIVNSESYYIAEAHGLVGLRQMGRQGEDRPVISGYMPKSKLDDMMRAFIDGIRAGKAVVRKRMEKEEETLADLFEEEPDYRRTRKHLH